MSYVTLTVYHQLPHPPGQWPPVRCPLFFATPVKSPLDKKAPGQTSPSGQTTFPVSGRESMYSVYYAVIVTGIGATFFKHTHKERHMVRE